MSDTINDMPTVIDQQQLAQELHPPTQTLSTECADRLSTLATHRGFLRETVRELTDGQAARRTLPSELCLAGLVKHVAATQQQWRRFSWRALHA